MITAMVVLGAFCVWLLLASVCSLASRPLPPLEEVEQIDSGFAQPELEECDCWQKGNRS
jgi:hypothetical protein